MTIAHCPRCREQVSIPGGTSRQARVRCPLCSEEYQLADALRSLPPLLLVVHDPEAEGSAERSGLPLQVSDVPAMVMDDGSEELAFAPATPVIAPAFKFESPAVPAARGSVVTRPRARRKQASPFRLIVQTIGGGVLGLAIAQLILWWMPGDWHVNNRDPFKLAAKVTPYAPYLVPVTLRGNGPTTQVDTAVGGPAVDATRADTSNRGPMASDDLDTKIPSFTFNPNASEESAKRPTARNNKKKEPKQEFVEQPADFPLPGSNAPEIAGKISTQEPDATPIPDVTLDPTAGSPKTIVERKKGSSADSPNTDSASTVVSKPTLNTPTGLRNPPAINVEEITTRLVGVASADLAWDSAENPSLEKKVELITEIYSQLALLGDAIAVVGSSQPEASVSLKPVVEKLNSLAAQPEKLTPIGKLAGIWVNDHHDEGAVLVGVVLSHRPCGSLFETQIRLSAKSDPIVSVVSTSSLADQLPVDTHALVLGRLVSEPERNLAGYEGTAERVLLHGVHVSVSEAKP